MLAKSVYASAVKVNNNGVSQQPLPRKKQPNKRRSINNNNDYRNIKFDSFVEEDGFTTVVSRKKRHQKVMGTRTPSTVKCAPRFYDIFVGNFDLSVGCDDINKYILKETYIKALRIEEVETRKTNANLKKKFKCLYLKEVVSCLPMFGLKEYFVINIIILKIDIEPDFFLFEVLVS